MTLIETYLDIDRPPSEVFAFVSDHTNAPLWQKGLHEVRRVSEGPIGVGTEHVFVRTFAGRRIESRNRFIQYNEAARFVEFEFPTGFISGTASYLVEPRGAATCRLTSRMQFGVSGAARLATPLLARLMKRDSERDEARLKALLENPGATSSQL
jgi:hypothetical protein